MKRTAQGNRFRWRGLNGSWKSDHIAGTFYFTIHGEDGEILLSLWAGINGRKDCALVEHWHLEGTYKEVIDQARPLAAKFFREMVEELAK